MFSKRLGQSWLFTCSLAMFAGPMAIASDSPREAMSAAYDEAGKLRDAGEYAAAAQKCQRALELAERLSGAASDDAAVALGRLGTIYLAMTDYAKAEPTLRRCLEIRLKNQGPNHQQTGWALNALGSCYDAMGAFAKAEPLLLRSLAIRERLFGTQNSEVASTIYNLAYFYVHKADFARAESLAQRSLKIFVAVQGPAHSHVASNLQLLGDIYIELGQYAQAEQCLRQSLEIQKAQQVPNDATLARLLGDLATLYGMMGEYAKAEPLHLRCLEITEARFGPDQPRTADVLNNLANFYGEMGDYAKEESALQRSLKIYEATLGPESSETARAVGNLGACYLRIGDYANAESLLRRCIDTLGRSFEPNDPRFAIVLGNLGSLYMRIGQYEKAEELLLRDLEIKERALGRDHPDVAKPLRALGELYRRWGRYVQAEASFRRSLETLQDRLGPESVELAVCLDRLANLKDAMGQYAEAEALYERCLRILEAKVGPEHPEVAECLHSMANLFADQGLRDKAGPLYERSLKIREAKSAPGDPLLVEAAESLAILWMEGGQFAKAEPLLERALATQERKLGPDHPDVAARWHNMAMLREAMGQRTIAESLYQRALAIEETSLGPEHPRVINSLNSLALLHIWMNERQQAAAEFDRERRTVRRHAAGVLPTLGEREQLSFLEQKDRTKLRNALSFARENSQDPKIVALSAGWVANGKAIVQETLARQALLARQSRDPATAARASQLRELQGRLAALAQTTPRAGQEADHQRRLAELTQQEQQLARLILQGSALGDASSDSWIEVEAVRKALHKGDLLADIVRLEPTKFDFKFGDTAFFSPARYVAWLTPPVDEGDIRIVDLGEAAAIEAAAARVRKAMAQAMGSAEQAGSIAEHGEAQAAAAIATPLAELSSLVLAPILMEARDVKRLIVSPDADLWLVPWAALPLADGRFAIEAFSLRYALSARDLAPQARGEFATGRPVIMADPDFNLGRAEAQAATRAVLRGANTAAGAGELARRATPAAGALLGKVERLPGTAAEAKAIAPPLAAFAHGEPLLYTDRYALEGVFKVIERPRALIVSTHGFFLPDQNVEPDRSREAPSAPSESRGAMLGATRGALENPLLRCGLLLAGCNQRDAAATGDDGVLTGLEIVGVDLRGTELVVLSACETGLGETRNGEGVAGLRQAFQLAGARAVVATLWQIPDRQTSQLMGEFFTQLGAGQSKDDALRSAQRAMIEQRRAKHGAAHPFFWAAFTLTGN